MDKPNQARFGLQLYLFEQVGLLSVKAPKESVSSAGSSEVRKIQSKISFIKDEQEIQLNPVELV